MHIRKLIVQLHGWIGITCGILLSLTGISGSILLFRPQLEPTLQAHLLHVTPRDKPASWQVIYENAQQALPQEQIQHIFIAPTRQHSHELWLHDGELLVYVDPYTARVLGSRVPQRDVFGWLAQLHIRLLSGETGHTFIGVGGLMLLLLSLTGIVLWWPRQYKRSSPKANASKGLQRWKRALVPIWNTNWKGRNYELHRVTGVFTSLFLIASALSGVALVWSELTGDVLGRIFGSDVKTKVQARPGTWRSLDELVQQANLAFPEGQLRRITFPRRVGAPLVIRKKLTSELHPNGMNSISLDPVTGQVLQVIDSRKVRWGTRLMNLRYPLHIGAWGGLISKIVYAVVGLAPAGLFISGAVMWLLRRGRRRRTETRHP